MGDLTLVDFRNVLKSKKPIEFNLKEFLFPEQLAFVQDVSPFKTAVCSRRAGKTISCAADLLNTAVKNADCICLYITLSRKNAKRIIWRELKKINKRFRLGGIPNETDLSMSFSNGSYIYCCGAKDRGAIEDFRGLPIKLCYLDETQSFPKYIKELIDDVIGPALMDYSGSLCLIGTPGPVPAGYFFDCSKHSQWSHHFWTFWQNPFIPIKSKKTHQEVFERELKRRGVTTEDPSVQREWFGKWVLDTDSLVFKYKPDVNDFKENPKGKITYIMGVDYGFEDADAIAILAWNENSPVTYLVDELVMPKQGLTPLANQIEEFRKKYDVSKIVADFGGLGKKISEEMIKRWQIPVTAADKTRKIENIELLNDALRTKRFMARAGSRFASDTMLVEWDHDKSTPDKRVISDRFHSDILDAALYAFRESPAYAWTPPVEKPKPGTAKYYEEETTGMEKAAEEYFRALEDLNNDPNYNPF